MGRISPAALDKFNVDGWNMEMIGAEHSPGFENTAGSTVIAVFQNIISFAVDLTGCSRRKAVICNTIAIILLSLPCVLGYNLWSGFAPLGADTTVLDLEDFIVSNNLLPLGSLVYLTFCTSRYGWGWKNFLAEAEVRLINSKKGPAP